MRVEHRLNAMKKRRKMPRDMNQLGKMIVDMASGEVEPEAGAETT